MSTNITTLKKLHKEIGYLISDEDLDEKKLQQASEGLIPSYHHAVNNLIKERKELKNQIKKLYKIIA